jgi:hypothetical protein
MKINQRIMLQFAFLMLSVLAPISTAVVVVLFLHVPKSRRLNLVVVSFSLFCCFVKMMTMIMQHCVELSPWLLTFKWWRGNLIYTLGHGTDLGTRFSFSRFMKLRNACSLGLSFFLLAFIPD